MKGVLVGGEIGGQRGGPGRYVATCGGCERQYYVPRSAGALPVQCPYCGRLKGR